MVSEKQNSTSQSIMLLPYVFFRISFETDELRMADIFNFQNESNLSSSGFAPQVVKAALYFVHTSSNFTEAIDRSVKFAGKNLHLLFFFCLLSSSLLYFPFFCECISGFQNFIINFISLKKMKKIIMFLNRFAKIISRLSFSFHI